MKGADGSLKLVPEAEACAQDGTGIVRCRGAERPAADATQTVIIEALAQGNCSVNELEDAVRSSAAGSMRDDEVSLALARFILDFGEFLET